MTNERILVTGGCGYIGSHTCLELLNNDYDVIVFDSLNNSSKKSIDNLITIGNNLGKTFKNKINFFQGDLRDKDFLRTVFELSKKEGKPITGVVHFAGLKAVSESVKLPLYYWNNNIISTIYLLEIMQEFNCKKFIFSGSASVYGEDHQSLISEFSKIKPTNPYSETKYTIERLLKNLFDTNNDEWKIIILRYFNPVGAHPSGLIGENPAGIPNNLFPLISQVGLGLRKNLKVYGKDWPTHDGTCIRDYIHVMDLASAHLKSLEYLSENNSQIKVLNVGTAIGKTVLEVINNFIEVNKCVIPFVFADRRNGDVPYLVADNSLAKEVLNWNPKFSFDSMCKDAWRWHKINPLGYN